EWRHRQAQTEQHKSCVTLHLPSQFLVGALPLDTSGGASHCPMTPVTLPRAAGNEKVYVAASGERSGLVGDQSGNCRHYAPSDPRFCLEKTPVSSRACRELAAGTGERGMTIDGQIACRGESLARLKGSAALWALIAGLSASPALAQQTDAPAVSTEKASAGNAMPGAAAATAAAQPAPTATPGVPGDTAAAPAQQQEAQSQAQSQAIVV